MVVPDFHWPGRASFRNRSADLAALETWWQSPTRDALCLYGRRRVGKSWLFRAFADGKPAVVLVADSRLPAPQMSRFADELEPIVGVRPAIRDVADLLRACYRLGRERRVLVVIDELPYLLPAGAARDAELSVIQRVMEEERDGSQTKLIVCGSVIALMESLLAHSSPLHGRLAPLDVRPLTFAEARPLLDPTDTPVARVTRYAVSGGMARYLAELGHGDLGRSVRQSVLDARGVLFNDPRAVLEQELRQPATYFSILEELAAGEKTVDHLVSRTGAPGKLLAPYLSTLQAMRLVSARLPVGAPATARGRRLRIDDGFIRFWFRFVFPHQQQLQEGLDPASLWSGEIAEFLPDHVAPTFEALCARYVRERFGREAPTVGPWWGRALHGERRAGRRQVEEVDIVGAHRSRLQIVGECRWTAKPMGRRVLDDLREFKLPAILQEGSLKPTAAGPRILLFCRSGFDADLLAATAVDSRIELVGVDELVGTLDGGYVAST
jgi:hypothetical protein